MKKTLLLLVFISFLNANITIKNAWQKVLQVDEGLKASKMEVEHSYQLKKAARSMYLPDLSLSGSYTRIEKELAIEGDIDLSSIGIPISVPYNLPLQDQDIFIANLSLLWPIYTGGKIDAAQDMYAAQEQETKAKYQMEKDKSFLKLIQIYYGVVISEALLKTRVEAQNALTHHYENAKKLKSAGQVASIEVLNARVKLDSAKIETRKAKYKYEIIKLALKDMIGESQTPSSYLFIDTKLKDEKEFEKNTLESYAGLDVIKSKKNQVDSLITIEKAAYKPTFFVFGNYLLYKDNSPLMDMTPDWTAGIGVKLNIISRDGKSEKIAAAKLLKNRLTHTLNKTQNDLTLLVQKTYKEMLQYKQEYTDLSSSLSLAKENLRLRKLAFKEGLATSVDVVDAQMFLTGAKTKRLNAIYNYVQKISQLAVLSGDKELFFEFEQISMEIK